MSARIVRSRVVVATIAGSALTLAVVATPFASSAASNFGPAGMRGCPTKTEIVGRFGRGLGRLVAEGSLTRAEAREAGGEFAAWVRFETPTDLGCRVRDAALREGRELFDLIGLTPPEARAAFRDGQSLAEMAQEHGGVGRRELVDYLNGVVAAGLGKLEAAGAIDPMVAAAFADLAADRIDVAVDRHVGDPLPEGWGSR